MISAGKRKPRYGLDVVLVPETLPQIPNSRQSDRTSYIETGGYVTLTTFSIHSSAFIISFNAAVFHSNF
jgi:hypothetical protein